MMLNKLKFFSLIFATVFMVACSSTDTQESSADAGSDSSDDAVATVDTASNNAANAENEAAAAASAAALAAQQEADALAAMLTVYYFDFDQASLSADTREALDIVASALKNSTANVRLEGHADERGTREYNLGLGERRANAVKRYITAQGVDAGRIEVISYGEEKPVAMGTDAASMAKNRRVELIK